MFDLLVETEPMVASGYEKATIDAAIQRNTMVERFLASPLGQHLRSIEGADIVEASGGRLLWTPAINEEIDEFDPCALLFPHGYLPIWTSIGGNAIVYCLNEAAFFWADHTSWIRDDSVMLPGTNHELPFTDENIPKGLLQLSTDTPGEFLADLRNGVYTDRLNELD